MFEETSTYFTNAWKGLDTDTLVNIYQYVLTFIYKPLYSVKNIDITTGGWLGINSKQSGTLSYGPLATNLVVL